MPMFIPVTPIDEMEGEKLIVHPIMLVNPMALSKIESVEVEPTKPVVPKVPAAGTVEPVAAPPSVAAVPVVPLLVTMITFANGNTRHVKEAMSVFTAL
jgi:hypothetical protein